MSKKSEFRVEAIKIKIIIFGVKEIHIKKKLVGKY